MERIPVYAIPGLGADHRIFGQLDLKYGRLIPIRWIRPRGGESLGGYALRLSEQIREPNPVLLGVSFGGMLATEITRHLQVRSTIIVSSCKHPDELPRLLKTAGRLRLHRAVPYWAVTRFRTLNRFIFDARSSAEDLYLKRLMLQHTDLSFVKHAVDMIMHWHAPPPPPGVIHIHGRQDRLLTPGRVRADYWIDTGGHFMIWNEAGRVSRIIDDVLMAAAQGGQRPVTSASPNL